MDKVAKKLNLQKTSLKKAELLKVIAEKTELKASKVEEVLEQISDVVFNELAQNKKLSVPKLGTFKPNYRPAAERVMAIGGKEEVKKIEEKYSIKFKAEKSLAEAFNEKMKKEKAINKKF